MSSILSSQTVAGNITCLATLCMDRLFGNVGRADFRRHLQLEFSVENLLFWEAIRDFRERYDIESPADNWELADQIFQRYVTEDSPLQVRELRCACRVSSLAAYMAGKCYCISPLQL